MRRGRLDSFVAAVRRHADISDDDVRPFGFDRREEGVEIAAGRRDVDLAVGLEQAADALPEQKMVLCDHDRTPQRERLRIWPPNSRTLIGFPR